MLFLSRFSDVRVVFFSNAAAKEAAPSAPILFPERSSEVREEFFLFESASKTFIKFSDIKNNNNGFFIPERKAAISIYLTMDKTNNIKIIFEGGKSFILPNQASNFLEYFEEKRRNIMLTSLIMRSNDPSISRVKIWTDNSLSFKNVKYIIKIFSQFGYDDFDIAVER